MRIHFIRHATFTVEYSGITLLVDPMLSAAGAMDPIRNGPDDRRNPLVGLPFDDDALRDALARLDGVLVTHTHADHWDPRAAALLSKDTPVLCQPRDESVIRGAGFTSVTPVVDRVIWHGVGIARTGGRHGTGEIGQSMGPVSGFVLRAGGEPTLYIAGDTIWCAEVDAALTTHRPNVVVVNAGAAQFLAGDPITMTADDVARVCTALPATRVVAVHMEAINHCRLTRTLLDARLAQAGLRDRVDIPADGAYIEVPAHAQ